MSNLMPQKRLDKNGRMVTRHVLSATPSPASSAIPSPSIKVPAKQAPVKKPLPKQLKDQIRMTSISQLSPDTELLKALDTDKERMLPMVSVRASDVQLFDMFSITSASNAAILMCYGIKTPEEAADFMMRKGISHLLVDRRDIMNKALGLRVNAWTLLEAPRKFGVDELSSDPDLLIKAARLSDSSSLPEWSTNAPLGSGIVYADDKTSYAHEVLKGSISYDDVMTIGISVLAQRVMQAEDICHYLNEIHSGTAGYDIEVLSHVIQKSNYRNRHLASGMAMVDDYGSDFVKSISNLETAIAIDMNYDDRPVSVRSDMINYSRDGSFGLLETPIDDVVRLFDNDVPPETAYTMLKQKMSVDQIISVLKEGISTSISSGWL